MRWLFVSLLLVSTLAAAQNTYIALSVVDADRTAKWYADNLGFKEVHHSDAPNGQAKAVILDSPQFGMLEIVQHKRAVPLNQVLKGSSDDTRYLVHGEFKYGFFVDHLEDWAASLKKKNVRFRSEIFDDKPLKLRSFIIFDNDGNLVQFLERVH